MSIQRKWFVALACMALFCVVVGFLIQTRRTGPRVTIIGQRVEQDKQVIFFRLEGIENYSIFKVSRNEADLPDYAFVEVKPDGFIPAGPGSTTNEFGVLAPSGCVVWRVSVEMTREDIHSWKQAQKILSRWKSFVKQAPTATWRTVIAIWNNPIQEFLTVDSQVITNEPPSSLRSVLPEQ